MKLLSHFFVMSISLQALLIPHVTASDHDRDIIVRRYTKNSESNNHQIENLSLQKLDRLNYKLCSFNRTDNQFNLKTKHEDEKLFINYESINHKHMHGISKSVLKGPNDLTIDHVAHEIYKGNNPFRDNYTFKLLWISDNEQELEQFNNNPLQSHIEWYRAPKTFKNNAIKYELTILHSPTVVSFEPQNAPESIIKSIKITPCKIYHQNEDRTAGTLEQDESATCALLVDCDFIKNDYSIKVTNGFVEVEFDKNKFNQIN